MGIRDTSHKRHPISLA